MNLILSDVEETIMIVDIEGAPEGTVNVRPQHG
jgi:small nuclear ribonucleoprotein (snRNP)-like protein